MKTRKSRITQVHSLISAIITWLGRLCRAVGAYHGEKLYYYGGLINTTESTNQVGYYDFKSKSWNIFNAKDMIGLPALDSHSGGLDEAKGILYVFGGFQGESIGAYTNATYAINLKDQTYQLVKLSGHGAVPPPRAGHGVAYCNGFLYVFGGTDGSIRFHDTWFLNIVNGQWNQLRAGPTDVIPKARSGHSMSVCGHKIIVFGGIHDVAHEKDDLFMFDCDTKKWAQLETDSNLKKGLLQPSKTMVEGEIKSPSKARKTRIEKGLNTPNLFGTLRGESQSPTRKPPSPRPKESSPPPALAGGKSPHNGTGKFSPEASMMNGSKREGEDASSPQQERKHKVSNPKKHTMLAEFSVGEDKRKEFQMNSPTTQAMKHALFVLKGAGTTSPQKGASTANMGESALGSSPRRRITKEGVPGNFFGDQFAQAVFGKIVGNKPCPRDGHSAFMSQNELVIFGGDRHKMSFNDIYFCDLRTLK
jgi:N-acetylneuraminic acid mutarotase